MTAQPITPNDWTRHGGHTATIDTGQARGIASPRGWVARTDTHGTFARGTTRTLAEAIAQASDALNRHGFRIVR